MTNTPNAESASSWAASLTNEELIAAATDEDVSTDRRRAAWREKLRRLRQNDGSEPTR